MNVVAANNEGCAIISDDEVDLCSSSHCTRLSQAFYFLSNFRVPLRLQRLWRLRMKNIVSVNRLIVGSLIDNPKFRYSSSLRIASFYLAKFCISLRLQRIWRVHLKAAVSVNNFGVGSCIYLSKSRVAIGLQRRWHFICTKNTIFRNQFYSLKVLRDEMVGIRRAFFIRVMSLMESSLSRCQDNNVNCQEVFRIVSISCVKATRFLSHHFIVAVNIALETLPFPLDEDINMVFDDLIRLVNDSYEHLINALRNIHTHSLEDLPQFFRYAYLDASSIDNLMTVVINRLSYILSLF